MTTDEHEARLDEAVAFALEAFPKPVADYLGGNKSAVQFLIGQVFRRMGPTARPVNAGDVGDRLRARLDVMTPPDPAWQPTWAYVGPDVGGQYEYWSMTGGRAGTYMVPTGLVAAIIERSRQET